MVKYSKNIAGGVICRVGLEHPLGGRSGHRERARLALGARDKPRIDRYAYRRDLACPPRVGFDLCLAGKESAVHLETLGRFCRGTRLVIKHQSHRPCRN